DVPEETSILRGDGRVGERRRQLVGRHPRRPAALGASRLVEHLAVAVDDDRRLDFAQVEQLRRDRAESHVAADTDSGDDKRRDPTGPPRHRFASTVCVPARPKISGAYISSARVGAAANVPTVVARTTYENS